jgi:cytochrome o ubiquinol oxidase operon protein cyoD
MQMPPDHSADAGRGSLKTYAVGFILSVGLTAFAFALVGMGGGLSRGVVLVGILAAAIAQILVQLRCFLHLGTGPSARWNVMSLVFTLLIMLLFVGGTLWIMTNLNSRMM